MRKQGDVRNFIREAKKFLEEGDRFHCHERLCDIEELLTLKPKRTVKQYTLDGGLIAEYKNCAVASRAIGNRVTRQDISLAARGKAHAAGGYRWEWGEV